METYEVKSCEEETWVSLGLFTDVGNSSWIRNEATSGRMEAAVLDPSLIVSSFQVLAAVTRALMLKEQQQMKTKSIYSEIIFCLSPSSNFFLSLLSSTVLENSEKKPGLQPLSHIKMTPSTEMKSSFKSFGIKDTSKNLLVVTIHSQQANSRLSEILKQIEGNLVSLTGLHSICLQDEIVKLYKISPEELNISSLENVVVTKLAIKDAT